MRVRREPRARSGRAASLARVVGRSPTSRRLAPLVAALAVAAAGGPEAAVASPQSDLAKSLESSMRKAGPHSGALVRDAEANTRLFAWNPGTPRILASNTKLLTLGAALAKRGPDGTLATRAMAGSPLHGRGILDGNLYLVGGGDPAFGSDSYVRANYGPGGATVERLAKRLYNAGLREVRGRVVGDESLYDSRRSGPAEHYKASGEVGGPLTALVYNHGLTSSGHFQTNPPEYAAARLKAALESRGAKVGKSSRSGRAPSDALELARIDSMPMRRLAELTGLPSDNLFAELFAKGLGGGTTAGGAKAIVRFATGRGAKVHLSDGSGLSRDDQAAPREVVRYLLAERSAPEGDALYSAIPTAGVNGTLRSRMRSGAAHGNCHAKTGTLHGVSTLSGYCRSRGGHTLVFSILMNGQSSDSYAHSLQDRMAQAIAGYDG